MSNKEDMIDNNDKMTKNMFGGNALGGGLGGGAMFGGTNPF